MCQLNWLSLNLPELPLFTLSRLFVYRQPSLNHLLHSGLSICINSLVSLENDASIGNLLMLALLSSLCPALWSSHPPLMCIVSRLLIPEKNIQFV